MKLHLPKLLRVALLSAMSISFATTAHAVEALIDVGLVDTSNSSAKHTTITADTTDVTINSGQAVGAFTTDDNQDKKLITAFGSYEYSKSTTYGAIIPNHLKVNGKLTINGNGQLVLWGQIKGNMRDAYSGLIADEVIVNGDNSVKNLVIGSATLGSLTINSGKVSIHESAATGGNSVNNLGTVPSVGTDCKIATIKNALNVHGGTLTMGASGNAQTGPLHYATYFGANSQINQTGGDIKIHAQSYLSGGITINQSGGTFNTPATNKGFQEFSLSKGIYTLNQTNPATGASVPTFTINNLASISVSNLLVKSAPEEFNINQTADNGTITLVAGKSVRSTTNLTLSSTSTLTQDSENGVINFGGDFSNARYDIKQRKGTINLQKNAKFAADTSTIGGKLSIDSGASFTTKELNLSKASKLENSGALVVGTETPTNPESSNIYITKDGKLNLSDGYGTAEHTTGAIKNVKMSAGELNYKDSVELTELSMTGGLLNISDSGRDNMTVGTLDVAAGGSIHMQINDRDLAGTAPLTIGTGGWSMSSGSSFVLSFADAYIEQIQFGQLTYVENENCKFKFKELVADGTIDRDGLKNQFEMEGMSNQWTLLRTSWEYDTSGKVYVEGTVQYNPWLVINEDCTISESIDDFSRVFKTGLQIEDAEVTINADNGYTYGTKIINSKVTLENAGALGDGSKNSPLEISGESTLIADAGDESVTLPTTIKNHGMLTLSGDFAADAADLGATAVGETHIGLDGKPDPDGHDTGFFRDAYTEYSIVNNSSTATLNAEDATITISGTEYLINAEGKTYILPEYETYFIDAEDTEHSVKVSEIQQASGGFTTLVDMAAGTLTVDDEVELKVTGGTVKTQSGFAVRGSISNATVTGNGVVDADISGNTTLQDSVAISGTGRTEGNLTLDTAEITLGTKDVLANLSSLQTKGTSSISLAAPITADGNGSADKIVLTTAIDNYGALTLNGQYDVEKLDKTPISATLVDVHGTPGINGFSRDEGTSVQMVNKMEETATLTKGEGFGVFIGTREGSLDEETGIVTFGAGVNYATYTIVSGDDHKASEIIDASKDADGVAQLEQVVMQTGALQADANIDVVATQGEELSRGTINVSNAAELSGSVEDTDVNISSGTVGATLTGTTAVTVTGTGTISGDNSHTGDTTITGPEVKLTVASETALGDSTVYLRGHGTLDLGGFALDNAIHVEGCTVSGASQYEGEMTVSGDLLLTDDIARAAWVTLTESGSLKGKTLETRGFELQGGNRTIATNLTVLDDGAIVLHAGNALTITGNLTIGKGVCITLVDGGYAEGDALLAWTGTLTGNVADMLLDAEGDFLLEQDGKTIKLALPQPPEEDKPIVGPGEDEEDKPIVGPGEDEEDKPIVGPGEDEEDKPIVGPGEDEEDKPIVGPGEDVEDKPIVDPGEDEEDKPIVGPDAPAAPVFDQATADVLAQSNWGIFTASRAFTAAVQGQRNNMGCIAGGRGTAWASLLGGMTDISGSGVASGSDITLFGAAVGVDMKLGKRSSLGVAFGYTDGEVSADGLGDIDQESGHIALYGEHGLKKFAADSCLSLDWVAATGITESKYMGTKWEQDSVQLNARLSWNKQVTERFSYNVFGGLEYFASESDCVQNCKSGSVQNLRGKLGAGVRYVAVGGSRRITDGKSGMVTSAPGCERVVFYGEVSYINDMVRNNPSIEVNGLRGSGANPGRQGVGVEAGATIRLGERWSANANYSFNAMDDTDEHILNIGASRTF